MYREDPRSSHKVAQVRWVRGLHPGVPPGASQVRPLDRRLGGSVL